MSQLCSTRIARSKHNHCSRLEVVAVEDIKHIAVFAIGFLYDSLFESIYVVIKLLRAAAHLRGFLKPCGGFVGILHRQSLKLAIDSTVALAVVAVGAVETLVYLCETVKDVARHIKRQHCRQDDIHQVDHLLTWSKS